MADGFGVGVPADCVVVAGTGSLPHAARRAAMATQVRMTPTTGRHADASLDRTEGRVTVKLYPLP